MHFQDFVVIEASPQRGRRVFTEHQRDVMRQQKRTGVPAMYSALEVSQDVSMMGYSDTQMAE